MTNVLAIARRELGAYFDSPLAYFVVPVYVVLVGGFALSFDDLFAGAVASFSTTPDGPANQTSINTFGGEAVLYLDRTTDTGFYAVGMKLSEV